MFNKTLIVEDSMVIAMTMTFMVQELGHEVMGPVRTGEEAIRQVVEDPPDLIIMDICLAGQLNGIEATTRIRAHQSMPVIYASGSTTLLAQEQDRELAWTEFLTKPVTQGQLARSVNRLRTHGDENPLQYETRS